MIDVYHLFEDQSTLSFQGMTFIQSYFANNLRRQIRYCFLYKFCAHQMLDNLELRNIVDVLKNTHNLNRIHFWTSIVQYRI